MEKNSIRWEVLLKGARGTLSSEEETTITVEVRSQLYVDDVRTPNAKKTYTVSIYKSSNNTEIGEVIVNGIAAITRKNNPTIYELSLIHI